MNAPPLFPSQVEDIQSLIDNPGYALHCLPGTGKTRTVIEAAARLYQAGEIDTVFCVVPANVRSVWASPDPVLGEVAKWSQATGVPVDVCEYHTRSGLPSGTVDGLRYVVTNPEFLRREPRLLPALAWAERHKTMLVVDESWMLRNPRASQSRAIARLRKRCVRIALLNGTPGTPLQQFTTFQLIDPAILDCRNEFHFKAKFCQMGGFKGKEVVGYTEAQMAEFARRIAPYVTVRDTPSWTTDAPAYGTLEVPMSEDAWKLYRDMEKDAVARLAEMTSVAISAGVVVMRLVQLTAGVLGGLTEDITVPGTETKVVSTSKIDTVIAELQRQGITKAIQFCQFRAEMDAAQAALQAAFPTAHVGCLRGGIPPEEREAVKRWFAPGGDTVSAFAVVHPKSGGVGLNLAQAPVAYFLSNTHSLLQRQQAEGRIFRPGQTAPVRFVDVLAVGPDGQQTVDHMIVRALRSKVKLEQWSAEAWREAIVAQQTERGLPLKRGWA